MNQTTNSSRITNGTIDNLVEDLSRLKVMGTASFKQSLLHSTEIIMKAPDLIKRFQIQTKAPTNLKEEEFLQAVDGFLIEKGMYLAHMTFAPAKLRSALALLPYYQMHGYLYKEIVNTHPSF